MNRILIFAGTGAAVLVALMLLSRRDSLTPQSIGQSLGGAAVSLAEGGIIGIGEAIGIPQTNLTECDRAIAEGRTWDASFACPAVPFVKSLFSNPTPAPVRQGGYGATGEW